MSPNNTDIVLATNEVLHTIKTPKLRVNYLRSCDLKYSKDYRWQVYLGDIVAVATDLEENESLSVEYLENWESKHLQKSSPHFS